MEGVKLSGVAAALGPAAKAGDILVRVAGKDIKIIYDYRRLMGVLKIGQETEMEVIRGGERKKLKITPGSRDFASQAREERANHGTVTRTRR